MRAKSLKLGPELVRLLTVPTLLEDGIGLSICACVPESASTPILRFIAKEAAFRYESITYPNQQSSDNHQVIVAVHVATPHTDLSVQLKPRA